MSIWSNFFVNITTPTASAITVSIPNSKTEINGAGISIVRDSTRYVVMDRSGSSAVMIRVGGDIIATGNITAGVSDARLKTIISNIDNPIERIEKINGVYYKLNEVASSFGYDTNTKEVGLIAQEIKEILPEIIAPAPFDDDGNGNSKTGENYMTIRYEKVVPLLVEAIKELSKEVKELKAKINGTK